MDNEYLQGYKDLTEFDGYEYQACYYEDDLAFMDGDMKDFDSFDTPEECNDYINNLIKNNKSGFIQLLLKSDQNYAEDFAIGDKPIYFK